MLQRLAGFLLLTSVKLGIIEEAAEKINRFPISLRGRKIFFSEQH